MTDWTGHIDVIGFGSAILACAGLMLRFIVRQYAQLTRDYKQLVENHLTHNTRALINLENTLQTLNETLRETRGK